jgi:hypothetical protein
MTRSSRRRRLRRAPDALRFPRRAAVARPVPRRTASPIRRPHGRTRGRVIRAIPGIRAIHVAGSHRTVHIRDTGRLPANDPPAHHPDGDLSTPASPGRRLTDSTRAVRRASRAVGRKGSRHAVRRASLAVGRRFRRTAGRKVHVGRKGSRHAGRRASRCVARTVRRTHRPSSTRHRFTGRRVTGSHRATRSRRDRRRAAISRLGPVRRRCPKASRCARPPRSRRHASARRRHASNSLRSVDTPSADHP